MSSVAVLPLPTQSVPRRSASKAAATEAIKDTSIETLRGFAVLLMVLGHVIGNTGDRGLRVEDDSLYRYAYYSFQDVRMPLFTVIAGFVYAMRPVKLSAAGPFLSGKARRLLLPLLTVGTLQFVVQHLTPGSNREEGWGDLWRVYVYGYDQFWFVQALFPIFFVMLLIDGLGLMKTVPAWLGWLGLAALASRFLPKPDLFSLWGYLYLQPYFLLGCGLNRFPKLLTRPAVVAGLGLLLLGGLTVRQAIWFGAADIDAKPTGWLALCAGLAGTALLFRFRRSIPCLAVLGNLSFSIYLFHVFGTAGSRLALSRLGVESRPALLLAGLAAGLILPIGIDLVLKQNRLLRTAFLGLR
jgi:fucose 4-O-acetylase-like acetyltransferase